MAQERMKTDERYGSDDDFSGRADATYIAFWVALSFGALYVLLLLCLRRQVHI